MPYNPKSLKNLGKPKVKAGERKFRLTQAALDYLEKQKNATQKIEELIMQAIESEQILVTECSGTLSQAIEKAWELIGYSFDADMDLKVEVIAAMAPSFYELGQRLREAVGDENAPVYQLMGIYFCVGKPETDEAYKIAFLSFCNINGAYQTTDGTLKPFSALPLWNNLKQKLQSAADAC